jgi:hypothetical protein
MRWFIASVAAAAAWIALAAPAPLVRVAPDECKPDAPARLDIDAADATAGEAHIRYTVTPLIDALDLRLRVTLPDGGAVLSNAGWSDGPRVEGDARSGSLRVRLPAGVRGAEIVLAAEIVFAADGDPTRPETARTRRSVRIGTVDRTPSLPVVHQGSEPSLDVTATRTKSGGKDGGR